MRVVMQLWREQGALRTAIGRVHGMCGELYLTRANVDGERQVQALQLLGVAERPPMLYEPRLTHLFDDELHFVGYERAGRAWVLQEWRCKMAPA